MSTIKFIFRLIYNAYDEWSHDRAARIGAALAYYALFSIAPLLGIMITIAGAVYGEAAAEGCQFLAQAARGAEVCIGVVYRCL